MKKCDVTNNLRWYLKNNPIMFQPSPWACDQGKGLRPRQGLAKV